jgi:hemerythrin-like domain-containing protein
MISPIADFDQPIEMLDRCHQRIRRTCDLLVRIASHIRARGCDDDARDAALLVVRFFDTAGANHHRDEEDDLFPALIHYVPSEELNAVRCLVFKLRAQHAELDTMWAGLRPQVMSIAVRGETELSVEIARSFAAATEKHIATEEAELLPLARRVLGESLLVRLGTSMARRRGLAAHAA